MEKEKELTKLSLVMPTLPENFEAESKEIEFDCPMCSDTLWVQSFHYRCGKRISYATPCQCRKRKAVARRLGKIDARFRDVRLSEIEPDPERHAKQAAALNIMLEKPNGSYALLGKSGTGKTHFFWALYRHVVECGVPAYVDTLAGVIGDLQKAIRDPDHRPEIQAGIFSDPEIPRALFLDDIDKARPTEYVAEKVFDLINAAHANGHQIVVTSNLGSGDLLRHFERADESGRYGAAIVRRILDGATEVEFL